jgi:hypothetical protein
MEWTRWSVWSIIRDVKEKNSMDASSLNKTHRISFSNRRGEESHFTLNVVQHYDTIKIINYLT